MKPWAHTPRQETAAIEHLKARRAYRSSLSLWRDDVHPLTPWDKSERKRGSWTILILGGYPGWLTSRNERHSSLTKGSLLNGAYRASNRTPTPSPRGASFAVLQALALMADVEVSNVS